MKYPTVYDAQMRLDGVFGWYQGQPCFVSGVTSDDEEPTQQSKPIVAINILDQDRLHKTYVDPNSDDFSVLNTEVGYVNNHELGYDAVYLVRNPVRKQKQGLSRNNTDGYSVIGRMGWPRVEEILKAMSGKYPKYKDVKHLSGAFALSRDVALEKRSQSGPSIVYFRQNPVYLIKGETVIGWGIEHLCKESVQKVMEVLNEE